MDILIQWLLKSNEEAHINGISNNCSKPTIFYCRVSINSHKTKVTMRSDTSN